MSEEADTAVADSLRQATKAPHERADAIWRVGRDFLLRRVLVSVDTISVVVAMMVSFAFFVPAETVLERLPWAILLLPAWLLVFNAYGLYSRDVKRVSHTTVDDIPWIFHAVVVGGLLSWLYYRAVSVPGPGLAELVTFAATLMGVSLLLRSAVRRGAVWALRPERVLVIGDPGTSNLVNKIRSHPEYGLDPVGVVTHGGVPPDSLRLPVVATHEDLDLKRVLRQYSVERVLVSRSELEERELVDLLQECRRLGLKLSLLPELFDVMGPSLEVDDIEGVTVLGINPPVLLRSEQLFKRALDLVISSIVLAAFMPLMVAIAVVIRVDSPGPILFRQARVGRHGRHFTVLKFRTMCEGAESMRAELLQRSNDPDWLLLAHDPRVTRVGRLLRQTSLDELPQLWNVLTGNMSLVGPRPLPVADDERVEGWARGRLDLTPGLTGLWQVLGRTVIPFREMVQLDYMYVTNWSLWTDIRLILRTVPVLLARKGAN